MSSSTRVRPGTPSRIAESQGTEIFKTTRQQLLIEHIEKAAPVKSDEKRHVNKALIRFISQDPPNHLDMSDWEIDMQDDTVAALMAIVIPFAVTTDPGAGRDWRVTWPAQMREFPDWAIALPDWKKHVLRGERISPPEWNIDIDGARYTFNRDKNAGNTVALLRPEGRDLASSYYADKNGSTFIVPRGKAGEPQDLREFLLGLQDLLPEYPSVDQSPHGRWGFHLGYGGPHSTGVALIHHDGKRKLVIAQTRMTEPFPIASPSRLAAQLGIELHFLTTESMAGFGCRAQTIKFLSEVTGKDADGNHLVDAAEIFRRGMQLGQGFFSLRLPPRLIKFAQTTSFIDEQQEPDANPTVHYRKDGAGGRVAEDWTAFTARHRNARTKHRDWARNKQTYMAFIISVRERMHALQGASHASWPKAMRAAFMLEAKQSRREARQHGRHPGDSHDLTNLALDLLAVDEWLAAFGMQGWSDFRTTLNGRGQTLLASAADNGQPAAILLELCLRQQDALSPQERAQALSIAVRCGNHDAIRKLLPRQSGKGIEKVFDHTDATTAIALGSTMHPSCAPLAMAAALQDETACNILLMALESIPLRLVDRVELLHAGIDRTIKPSESLKQEWLTAWTSLCAQGPRMEGRVLELAQKLQHLLSA